MRHLIVLSTIVCLSSNVFGFPMRCLILNHGEAVKCKNSVENVFDFASKKLPMIGDSEFYDDIKAHKKMIENSEEDLFKSTSKTLPTDDDFELYKGIIAMVDKKLAQISSKLPVDPKNVTNSMDDHVVSVLESSFSQNSSEDHFDSKLQDDTDDRLVFHRFQFVSKRLNLSKFEDFKPENSTEDLFDSETEVGKMFDLMFERFMQKDVKPVNSSKYPFDSMKTSKSTDDGFDSVLESLFSQTSNEYPFDSKNTTSSMEDDFDAVLESPLSENYTEDPFDFELEADAVNDFAFQSFNISMMENKYPEEGLMCYDMETFSSVCQYAISLLSFLDPSFNTSHSTCKVYV